MSVIGSSNITPKVLVTTHAKFCPTVSIRVATIVSVIPSPTTIVNSVSPVVVSIVPPVATILVTSIGFENI